MFSHVTARWYISKILRALLVRLPVFLGRPYSDLHLLPWAFLHHNDISRTSSTNFALFAGSLPWTLCGDFAVFLGLHCLNLPPWSSSLPLSPSPQRLPKHDQNIPLCSQALEVYNSLWQSALPSRSCLSGLSPFLMEDPSDKVLASLWTAPLCQGCSREEWVEYFVFLCHSSGCCRARETFIKHPSRQIPQSRLLHCSLPGLCSLDLHLLFKVQRSPCCESHLFVKNIYKER